MKEINTPPPGSISSEFEDGIESVLYIRCMEHRFVPAYNHNEVTGAECAACAVIPLQKRLAWRPIKTAPKNGTDILLYWEGRIYMGFWLDNTNSDYKWAGWRTHGMHSLHGIPSHWMPLPEPPTT